MSLECTTCSEESLTRDEQRPPSIGLRNVEESDTDSVVGESMDFNTPTQTVISEAANSLIVPVILNDRCQKNDGVVDRTMTDRLIH